MVFLWHDSLGTADSQSPFWDPGLAIPPCSSLSMVLPNPLSPFLVFFFFLLPRSSVLPTDRSFLVSGCFREKFFPGHWILSPLHNDFLRVSSFSPPAYPLPLLIFFLPVFRLVTNQPLPGCPRLNPPPPFHLKIGFPSTRGGFVFFFFPLN